MSERTITVVSAGLGTPSSSRLLADQLAAAAGRAVADSGGLASIEVIELRDLAVDIANRFVTGYAAPRLAAALRQVEEADALIAVTPVFSASYSGLFKSFFDLVDNKALEGKPVLIGATGGTSRHSMVLDFALRPLFSYLRASVVPTAVYAAPEDWGAGESGVGQLSGRIVRAGRELSEALGTAGPAHPRPEVDGASFEDLMAGLTR